MNKKDNAPIRADGYHHLGRIGDAEVGVQHSLRGQSILVRRGDTARHLAGLLGVTAPDVVQREGLPFLSIPHTDQVDGRLQQLVEVLISVRYAHPTLVQLHLALSEAEGAELEP
jgi:hypothetical protein